LPTSIADVGLRLHYKHVHRIGSCFEHEHERRAKANEKYARVVARARDGQGEREKRDA
jgi:hypothetical protein